MTSLAVQVQSSIEVQDVAGELVVDSRLIAERLGIEHEYWEHLVVSALDEFPLHLTAWDLLAVFRHSSLIGCEIADLWSLVDSVFYPCFTAKERRTLAWLKLSVMEGVGQDALCQSSEGFRVSGWFRDNFLEFFPNGTLLKVQSRNRKRPDFLIDIEGTVIPVECKLSFGKPALKQLSEYIKLWGTKRGIAVATKFVTDVPANIDRIICP